MAGNADGGLRRWARRMKREVLALWLVARHPATPWYVKLLALAVTAYALSPVDLIPDFVPVLGYLDDLLIVPLGAAGAAADAGAGAGRVPGPGRRDGGAADQPRRAAGHDRPLAGGGAAAVAPAPAPSRPRLSGRPGRAAAPGRSQVPGTAGTRLPSG
ncbi:MAG: YkvA family protein [Dongiaceae bacterium]